jgi:hypothetical protein
MPLTGRGGPERPVGRPGGKGPDQVGQGFSVDARRLAEGSQDITGLLGRCEAIAADAMQAITGMGGTVGHAGLASALSGAAEQGTKASLDLGTAHRHVYVLTATASTYTRTEQDLVRRSGDIVRGRL